MFTILGLDTAALSFAHITATDLTIGYPYMKPVAETWFKTIGHQGCNSSNDQTRTTSPINTLRPGHNGRHFADDTFNCIFLTENVLIPIQISMKFVPKGSINNIATLVQIMAWRCPGDKPLSEPMMVTFLAHICVTRPQWFNNYEHLPPSKAYVKPFSRQKGVFFHWEAQIREIKKMGSYFKHKSAKFWNVVKILLVSACFHPACHLVRH